MLNLILVIIIGAIVWSFELGAPGADNVAKPFMREYGSVLGPALTASVALLIARLTLAVNAGVNLRNKRIDVIIHCNSRYDELYKLRMEIDERANKVVKKSDVSIELSSEDAEPSTEARDEIIINHKVEAYFRRYWGLKSDELDYWLAGYVDPETIVSWLMYTTDALAGSGSRIPNEDYFEQFTQLEESHDVVNQRFVNLVRFLNARAVTLTRSDRYAAIMYYLNNLEKDDRTLINKLSRHTARRLDVIDLRNTLLSPAKESYDAILKSEPWLLRFTKVWRRGQHVDDALQVLDGIEPVQKRPRL